MTTPFPIPNAARRAAGVGRPRVIFYGHNENSLGRLRRTLAIAGELARRRPDAALLGLVGHPQIEAYSLPPGFDYVKLPALGKWRLYDDLPPGPTSDSALPGVRYLREGLIRQIVSSFVSRLLVVETPPGGAGRELVRTLYELRAAWPRPTLALILRDVEDDAPSVRKNWEQEGYYELLDHVYDHILVVGSREVFDPIREYRFSPAAAAKTTFCGYIRRPELLTPPEPIREQLGVGTSPLVVVSVGGGRDGITVLRAYLAALAERSARIPRARETKGARLLASASASQRSSAAWSRLATRTRKRCSNW